MSRVIEWSFGIIFYSFLFSEGFGKLTNLKELNMFRCIKLESLPDSESRLTSHFLISNFGNLMSEGFRQLANLKHLNLRYCRRKLLPARWKDNLVAQGCELHA